MKKLTPSLRFCLFSSPYEQNRLSDIAEVKGGFAFDSKKFKNEGIFQVVKMSNVYNNCLDLERSKSFVDSINTNEKDSLLIKGDILITLTGTVGKQDYGYLAIIDGQEKLYLNQRLARIRPTKANPYYLYNNLFTKKFRYQFFYSSKGGTGNQSNVGTVDLSNIKLIIPSLEEQTKIATFLSAVDSKINSLERLVSHWQAYKKGIMQKIFSQQLRFKAPNGEDFPEWESKTLGEISTIRRGASPRPIADPKWFSSESKIGWVRISDVTASNIYLENVTQYLSEEGIKRSVLLDEPHLILSIAASVGKPIINKIPICIHDGFIVFKNLNADMLFTYYYLLYIQNQWLNFQQPGTQFNLNSDLVSSMNINLPSPEEQTKIANFLSSLDDKISHLQQQLTSYRQFKKALLQQMFV